MKNIKFLLIGSLIAVGIVACVVETHPPLPRPTVSKPVPTPDYSHLVYSENRLTVAPTMPPYGSKPVEPTFPAPAANWEWAYHPIHGYGWFHENYGWVHSKTK